MAQAGRGCGLGGAEAQTLAARSSVRCESIQCLSDWSRRLAQGPEVRRSHHNNSTIEVHDRPEHDDIEVYIQVLRLAKLLGMEPEIWCHDLADACRAYPVRDPAEAYILLNTLTGPTLWRHRVLPFGSPASVWHFGRLTDAMWWLVRTLLIVCILHYVDDLGSIQDSSDSASAFHSFSEFCDILGYRLKTSKAQAPGAAQKLLGVILEVTSSAVRVRADPRRVQKLTLQIEQILHEGKLEPEAAAKLAGKLGFVQSTAFGRTGSAALRPIHARANTPALVATKQILASLTPRFVPFVQPTLNAVIYTDAFFEMGERIWKLSDPDIPTNISFKKCCSSRNGWGFVVRIGTHVTYGHGSVSSGLEVLQPASIHIFS